MFAIADVEHVCRENLFDRGSIQKGLSYARGGRVLKKNITIRDEVIEIHALVQGSHPRPYKVTVDVAPDPDDARHCDLEGECSCPVGYNCKHVVAAIAAAANRDSHDFSAAAPLARIGPTEERAAPAPLSYALSHWLQDFASPAAPPAPPPQLVYILSAGDSYPSPNVRITVMTRKLKKNGQWGKAAAASFAYSRAASILATEPYKSDGDILRQLFGENGFTADLRLTSTFGAVLLQKIIATNRCFWVSDKEVPLALGEPRPAIPAWRELPDGSQQATFDVSPPASSFLPLDPPWFIDTAAHRAGPLQIAGPPAVAARWLLAPPVPAEQSASFAQFAARLDMPAPRPIEIITRRQVQPTSVLHLEKVRFDHPVYFYGAPDWRYDKISEMDVVHVEFDYEGARVASGDSGEFVVRRHEGVIQRIERMRRHEKDRIDEALSSGLALASNGFSHETPRNVRDAYRMTTPEAWLNWITQLLPGAEARGWKVEIDPSFSFRPVAIDDWYSETLAPTESANDWFSYELGIIVDGERINLLPMLGDILKHLKATDSENHRVQAITTRLPDGRVINIPADRLRAIAATLAEIFDPDTLKNGRLEIGRLRAAELIDLHDSVSWRGPGELQELAKKIHAFEGIAPLAPPPTLNATLRPYQLDGLAWLQFLREHDFGGILADDMGLGKTVQALAHILAEKDAGRATAPSLVIAPTSLMPNWRAEAAKFTPDLKVLILHGTDRKMQFDQIEHHDLIVTSYALLPRDREVLEKQHYHLLILDEAQYIKNPRTQWAEIARSLKSNHRLCMTGTPMENHLGELWSLMHFLSPGYLGPEKQFRKIYRDPIEKLGDGERKTALAKRVRPFIMRRKKEDVAKDLPEKTEIIRNVELDGKQRDLYETIRLAMHERVQEEVAKKGMSRAHIVILDALLKLRQVCCDPRLVKLDRARTVKESAKLELLTEMLPELIAEGRRILLFSQFTSMLDLIEQTVDKLEIPFVRLTGDTSDRETPVKRFQAGDVPLFLISLKAGGTGLNLTAADTVIHYDPWWNPAVETQATDRAHRIGQTKKVFVYKLVTTGTVEEKILAMQQRKKELVAGLLGEGAQQNLQLSQSDLNHLLAPVGV